MHAHEHVFSVADIAFHKRHMVFAVERVAEAVCDERAVCGRHFGRRDGLDQMVVRFAVFLQVLDCDERQAPFFGFFSELACAHHGAVVAHDFAAQAALLKASEAAQIDGRFGVPIALEHAARFGEQGEHVPRTAEILRLGVGVDALHGRNRSLGGGNARGRVDVVD